MSHGAIAGSKRSTTGAEALTDSVIARQVTRRQNQQDFPLDSSARAWCNPSRMEATPSADSFGRRATIDLVKRTKKGARRVCSRQYTAHAKRADGPLLSGARPVCCRKVPIAVEIRAQRNVSPDIRTTELRQINTYHEPRKMESKMKWQPSKPRAG